MEPLLGVKIGCLFALLVLTLICGLIPICFKWFQTDRATGTALPHLCPHNLSLTSALHPLLVSCSDFLTIPKLVILGAACGPLITCVYLLIANCIVTPFFYLLGRHRRILCLLGCTSAGVFLGAGFMHMTAEALEGIESEIQKLVIQVSSRVAELHGCEVRMMNRTRGRKRGKE